MKFLLPLILLTGCATVPHDVDDDARAAHRAHLAEWCQHVGPCVTGRNGPMPAPGAPTLPIYSDTCGYLPPVYGSDC